KQQTSAARWCDPDANGLVFNDPPSFVLEVGSHDSSNQYSRYTESDGAEKCAFSLAEVEDAKAGAVRFLIKREAENGTNRGAGEKTEADSSKRSAMRPSTHLEAVRWCDDH